MASRFLQLHFLTSYPSALLNRDDAGFAKRIPFGGVTRTRISSQCLKRHWRTFDGEFSLRALSAPESIRSRLTFERFVLAPLLKDGVTKELARAATKALMDQVLGKSEKARKADEDDAKKTKVGGDTEGDAAKGMRTSQITVLGRPEVDYLLQLARDTCAAKPAPTKVAELLKERLGKDGEKNLRALRCAAGLDGALFGRMVTADILARGDAAVHVAHALTVHAEAAESDYFSAVDDLLQTDEEGQLGSAHISTTELTSGLFYGYLVVDLPLLVSNLEACETKDWLEADRSLAADVVERLVQIVARVSPGAKLGSTAPYSYAHLLLAESGNAQPRTLANAFLKPVDERRDVVLGAYQALQRHVQELDAMYGPPAKRCVAGIGPMEELTSGLLVERASTLAGLAAWARQRVLD
jgi:CRISPR system Cascade subunit CasC